MDQFVHDPSEEHWGFTSWNDFFTRHFKDGERPVAAPDEDRIITSVCESTPYKISTGVQRRDEFWVKEQPYSLEDLLAHDSDVDEFVDGAVFQAFPSAANYYRWHSPVAGTVRRASSIRARTSPRRTPRARTRPSRPSPRVTSRTRPPA
ncbi:phosphatidylserine decarboxylase [Kocuria marina]|uniref:phosphatidylserine decarboxylase n=1 Tax=Kocuria marina TaxID=223184 RepID=UPI0034A0B12C